MPRRMNAKATASRRKAKVTRCLVLESRRSNAQRPSDIEVAVPHHTVLPAEDRAFLDLVAEPMDSCRWKITRRSLLGAVDRGKDIRKIGAFLSSRTENSLPQTVEILLQEVQSRILDIACRGRAVLLECGDPVVLHFAGSDKLLGECCFVSGRHIVLMPGKERAFFERLKELGFTAPSARARACIAEEKIPEKKKA